MPNIIEITDLNLPELAVFVGLTDPQLRNRREPEKGIFIGESPNVIALALDAGCKPLAFLMEEKHITGKAKDIIARCGEVPVYTGSSTLLEQLTGFHLTRGVLCAMRRPQPLAVETVCYGAKRVAILDGLVDSTNVGAIFRTAAALHVDGLLLTANCCDPLSRRAVRVGMGSVFQIPWAWLPSGNYMEQLGKMGFETVAMALHQRSISIDHPQLKQAGKLAIVLGTEGHGLPQEVIDQCTYIATIPMSHQVESLNVATASAVAFWELRTPQ